MKNRIHESVKDSFVPLSSCGMNGMLLAAKVSLQLISYKTAPELRDQRLFEMIHESYNDQAFAYKHQAVQSLYIR